ncbi:MULTISPECIES: hypothetical protein [Streptomyces]|uniref:hypothetical protein n=1 Tax=Streptomyces TaxID=1883 RepID=UPI00346179CD
MHDIRKGQQTTSDEAREANRTRGRPWSAAASDPDDGRCAVAAGSLAAAAGGSTTAYAQTARRGSKWDKTFPRNPEVDHRKVSFRNRLGIELVVDLYSPKRLRGRARALIVGHPFGGVKEQTSGCTRRPWPSAAS